jgi:putative redox protein
MNATVEATMDNESDAVRVCSKAADGAFHSEADVHGHGLVADEPRDRGGDDAGPAPHDYLLVSLGTCTAMTLRAYAAHKGIDLQRVCVRVGYGATEDGDDGQRITHIRREIELEGELDAAQRERMVQIADRCPVHRTLTGEIRIESAEAAA